MTRTAHEAGIGRDGLYKTLSPEGNQEFGIIVRLPEALGLKLTVETANV